MDSTLRNINEGDPRGSTNPANSNEDILLTGPGRRNKLLQKKKKMEKKIFKDILILAVSAGYLSLEPSLMALAPTSLL